MNRRVVWTCILALGALVFAWRLTARLYNTPSAARTASPPSAPITPTAKAEAPPTAAPAAPAPLPPPVAVAAATPPPVAPRPVAASPVPPREVPVVPIQDGATIDYSIGAPVVKMTGADKEALEKAAKELEEATKDVVITSPK